MYWRDEFYEIETFVYSDFFYEGGEVFSVGVFISDEVFFGEFYFKLFCSFFVPQEVEVAGDDRGGSHDDIFFCVL